VRTVSSRAPRRAAALVVSAAAVLLVAACGGGSGDSSGGGTANGGAGNGGNGGNQAFTAYISCLQKNGVTITMPSRGARPGASGFPEGRRPSGMPRPSGSRGPGGGFPGGGGFLQKPDGVDDATWTKAQEACASVRPSFGGGRNGGNGANAAYRNCLQQHGVTLGETPPDESDPTVKKALDTCKVLRPQASPTPSA
jgi:hypothetical protein